MPINHERNFIFIHIIKTGGTSIEAKLRLHQSHKPASEYKKIVSPEIWNKYFKFAFVRNPWDKMVSQYHYNSNLFLKNKTFEEYIKLWDQGYRISTHPVYNSYYLHPELDFIGRFENLQSDFDFICSKIGVTDSKLPHINPSKHNKYMTYYSDETAEIVKRRFKEDIERFSYKFGD